MRNLGLGLAILLLAAANVFGTDLPRGTKITVRTSATVTSNRSEFGDPVDAVLAGDLVVNGKVIASQGAPAHCVVSAADPATGGKAPMPGSVSIRLETLETPEGTYHLSTNQYTREGRGRSRSPLGAGSSGGITIDSVGGVRPQSPLPTQDPNGVTLAAGGPEAIIPADTVITFKAAAVSSLEPKR